MFIYILIIFFTVNNSESIQNILKKYIKSDKSEDNEIKSKLQLNNKLEKSLSFDNYNKKLKMNIERCNSEEKDLKYNYYDNNIKYNDKCFDGKRNESLLKLLEKHIFLVNFIFRQIRIRLEFYKLKNEFNENHRKKENKILNSTSKISDDVKNHLDYSFEGKIFGNNKNIINNKKLIKHHPIRKKEYVDLLYKSFDDYF